MPISLAAPLTPQGPCLSTFGTVAGLPLLAWKSLAFQRLPETPLALLLPWEGQAPPLFAQVGSLWLRRSLGKERLRSPSFILLRVSHAEEVEAPPSFLLPIASSLENQDDFGICSSINPLSLSNST